MRRLLALIKKEFIQMRRDRITLALMMMLPVVQLIIFGFAINTDVKHLSTAVFDQSRTQESRDLIRSFVATQYFDIKHYTLSYEGVTELIQKGTVKVGIVIPHDHAQNLKKGTPAQVQVLVDATDSMSSASAINAAELVGLKRSEELRFRATEGKAEAACDIRVRAWYNRDFRSTWYIVPGILGIILTMTMLMITSMAIVRERERGTLEQLIVTPMRSWELMLGKIIPYITVGYVQLTLGLLVGKFIFRVPMRGSMALLYVLTLLFIVATLAWGILISTMARTQTQAMIMSIFGLLPSILLSGFVFPREGMPRFFQVISNILPLTWFLQLARGIMLTGVGINYLWPQLGALVILISFFLTVSLIKFRKTLD